MRYLVVLSMIIFANLIWSGSVFAEKACTEETEAVVISLQGSVSFDPNTDGSWHVAQFNEKLCEGGRIWVKPDSRASLALPGNDVLRLNENTVLTLKTIELNKTSILDIVKGFIHFISRKPKEVKIESGIANAAPLGTEFAFRVDENKANLWVYEGGVRFFNDKGSIDLKSGQAAEAYLGKAPQIRIDIKPEDAVNWALYYPPLLPYPDKATVIDENIRTAIQDYRLGHPEAALWRLDTLPLEKQTPYFYKVRAAMRLTVGQDQLALQDIDALLAMNPNDAEALALQSVRALTQNRKDEAYDLAQKAIAADPNSASAYSALSYAEQGRFKLEEALAAAEHAVKVAPHDAIVLARKAELQLTQGLVSDSEQTAAQAVSLDANLERTQAVIGFADLMRMETDKAKEHFDKAIQLDSTSPLARLGLGLAKIRDGDLEEGRRDIEIAAVLDPNNSLIRSYLGKAYYEERRNDLAEDQFKLARERDPKDPTPYFYDAIHKQATNRPVLALQDMQMAIERNDNRQAYRSKLFLDGDKAIRSAGLGRIYKELGFDDVARWQATASLSIDPANYSAHRLLADSYLYRPRYEVARASEMLQAQLLQPLNYYPLQPQLAYSDLNIPKSAGFADTAFNEYTRLFEGDHHRITATGLFGTNDTKADEAAISGTHEHFAYSLGQMHYQTNGFRPNADLKHDLYNIFAQYAFSPELSIQVEYRRRETEHGDIQMNADANIFDNVFRRNLDQDSYRFGIKLTPAKQSNFLFSYQYADRSEKILQSAGFPFDINAIAGLKTHQIESQYLFRGENINLQMGGGTFINDSSIKIYEFSLFDTSQQNQSFGYLYTNLLPIKSLTATVGLAYDAYHDNEAGFALNISQLSPKLGLQWRIADDLVFRVAAFQTVKPSITVNQTLQPVQIAGFNQMFDDYTGTRATQYGVGLDTKLFVKMYLGAEAFHRDLKVPVGPLIQQENADIVKWKEELFRLYFKWLPHENWIVNTEFRFENFHGSRLPVDRIESAFIPINVRFFDESGFFLDLGGQFVHQNSSSPDDDFSQFNFTSHFILVDTAIGYRFPNRYGIVSLEAKNLLDKQFKYVDRNFLMNESRATDLIPERLLFARLTLNF